MGLSPEQAIAMSLENSDISWRVMLEEEPIAIWGWRLDSFITGSASVWMFSYPAADRHKVFFARKSRELMNELLVLLSSLTCEVHAEHTTAVRWLRWLGFTLHDTRRVGRESFFIMRKER